MFQGQVADASPQRRFSDDNQPERRQRLLVLEQFRRFRLEPALVGQRPDAEVEDVEFMPPAPVLTLYYCQTFLYLLIVLATIHWSL